MNKSHSVADLAGTILLSAGVLCLHCRKAKSGPRERGVWLRSAVVTRNCKEHQIDAMAIVRRGVEGSVHGAALALVVWTAYELGKRRQAHDSGDRLRLCKASLN
jgi:hypothetical protein